MIDVLKKIFGHRNRELERMLSNDPTSNIENFRNHYRTYKPVLNQIQNFDKKDLLDIKETAEFAKRDLYSLVVNNIEPCLPHERDQFINNNFGIPPLRPIPPTKHELVDTLRLLDHLGAAPHDSLTALRYHFDSPEVDCVIDDIASRHLNFVRVEHYDKIDRLNESLYKLVQHLDHSFLDFLREYVLKYEDFMLIIFEPHITLSIGSTAFLAIFQSLHVRGTFKKLIIKAVARKEAEFSFFRKFKTYFVKKALKFVNLFIGPRKFGLFSDKLCDYIFIWICQSSFVISVFAYILFFRYN